MSLNSVPQGIKVNINNYLDPLKTHVLPWSKQHLKRKKWIYQKDGAPRFQDEDCLKFIEVQFPGLISHNAWPPSSLNYNPMDYSVSSVLQTKVYSKSYSSVESLDKSLIKTWSELSLNYLRTITLLH